MRPNGSTSVTLTRRGSTDPGGDPTRTVVRLQGAHDHATRPRLDAVLERAGKVDDADVVVDLDGITFLDASTIGAIVDAHNRLRDDGRAVSVRAPTRLARRLLDVCGLAFLIEEPAAAQTPAPALESWVAVPATDPSTAPEARPLAGSFRSGPAPP